MHDAPRQERARAMFEAACDLPPAEQDEFVRRSAAGDDQLAEEVLSLLQFDALTETGDGLSDAAVHVGGAHETEHPEAIGPYRIREMIGEGGCGVVYRASQTEPIRREVALKLIKPGMDSTSVIRRFELEREALQRMDHPNIARVLDSGIVPSGQGVSQRPYFVMELVEGPSITSHCRKERLELRDRVGLILQVCSAVQHAHSKGIIHRDLKPSNILVTMIDGKPCCKVIDFGVAKALGDDSIDHTMMTNPGMMIGTPEYMSPEQMRGSTDIDTRTDVYAVGVLLYELLAGSLPFDRETWRRIGLAELLRQIEHNEPRVPSSRLGVPPKSHTGEASPAQAMLKRVPRDLDWITLRAMSQDPGRRYATVAALGDDLRRFLAGEPVEAGPPTVSYKLAKFVGRNRAAVLAACVAGVGILVGSGLSIWFGIDAERSRELEEQQRLVAERNEKRVKDINDFLLVDLFRSNYVDELGPDASLVELLDKAGTDLDVRFAGDPDMQARLHYLMGSMYTNAGQLASSKEHYELAVRSLGESTELTMYERSDIYQGRASAYIENGELDKAAKDLNECLTLLSTLESPNESHRQIVRTALADVYQAQQKYDLAEPMLAEAIEYASSRDPLDLPWLTKAITIRLAMLGTLGKHEERLEQAEWLGRFSAEHNHAASALFAELHRTDAIAMLGRVEELQGANKQLIETAIELYGRGTSAHSAALETAAKVSSRSEQLDDAIGYLHEVLEINRVTFGPHHYEIERFTNRLAGYYQRLGDGDLFIETRTRGLLLRIYVAGPGERESLEALTPIGIELLGSSEQWVSAVLGEAEQLPTEHYKRGRFLANAAVTLGAAAEEDAASRRLASPEQLTRMLYDAIPEIEHAERPDEVRQIVLRTLPGLLTRQGKHAEADRLTDDHPVLVTTEVLE